MKAIVIAGTGSVSAAGVNAASSWQVYCTGTSTWVVDEETGLPVYRISNLPLVERIDAYTARQMVDRSSLLALHAAQQAITEAGWSNEEFAILVGCSRGPTAAWEAGYREYARGGSVSPRTSPDTTLGSIGFTLGEYFGKSSLSSTLSVTCSSGFHALLHGVALLRAGMVRRVLVGGTEASLTGFTLAQLKALRVYGGVAVENQRYACRPLDNPPSGMVLGEGAAFLALELAEAPTELPKLNIGFGRESGESRTGISEDGLALQQAMRGALQQDARPDVVIAHAPGTRRGDAAEQAAVAAVFGSAETLPVLTSLKWATGHTFGASGPLGLVAGIEMLRQGRVVVPAYLGGESSVVPRRVLVNATGFGGNAVSVLVWR